MEYQILKFKKRRVLYLILTVLICICAGFGYAWSVLQNPIITVYHWSDSSVAVAYTITVLCSTMSPLFFGALLSRISTRICILIGALFFGGGLFLTGYMNQIWQLYLFYGFISGIGVGFIYPRMMSYVIQLYPEHRGIASGIGTAAYGSGAILWAPAAARLIETKGLSGTFYILGILFLAIIVICALFLCDPPDSFSILNTSEQSSNHFVPSLNRRQMVRTGSFYLLVVIFVFGLTAGMLVISQAAPILQQELSYTSSTASLFVSIFAACNMLGRFLWGSLSDKLGQIVIMRIVFICCMVSMVFLSIFQKESFMLFAMGLAASCYGGLASILTPLTARVFGPKYITENYGVMYVVFGLASLIGPLLATTCRSVSSSYTGAYVISGILAVSGLLLSILLTYREHSVKKLSQQKGEEKL